MKQTIGWSVMIGVILLGVVPLWAAEAGDGYALLIQQSPPDAGFVTPGDGVHKTPIGETVTLSAVPKPGYRFMYWLGDVSNTSANDTTISIDSPKMVVAVFSRENHDDDLPGLGITDGMSSGGGGGGRYAGNPVQSGGSVSPTGSPDYPYTIYNFPPIDNDDDNDTDVPVPDGEGQEVPEPPTVLLLGIGSILALKRKTN
jgi:hypothetical protein